MKLKPLSDHIIIEPMAQEEITKSGIVLPGTMNKEKTQEGAVVAVGQGKLNDKGERMPMSVKKGDKVLFGNTLRNKIGRIGLVGNGRKDPIDIKNNNGYKAN